MEMYKGRGVPKFDIIDRPFIFEGKLNIPCIHYPIHTNEFCPTVECSSCLLDCGNVLPILIDYLLEEKYITKEQALKYLLDGEDN